MTLDVTSDPAFSNGADTPPGFHVKNIGTPPGAALRAASGPAVNPGDGLYGIAVQPVGGGVWRRGNYVVDVRLVEGESPFHGSGLHGIDAGEIVVP